MRAGISTACLYPMLLEDSLSTLISLNFRVFEVFVNTFSELGEDYLKKLARMAQESGSRVESVHPFTSGYENFLLFSDYERRFRDSLEFYKKYFNACNLLGAHIFVLHGRRSDKTSITDRQYFGRYMSLYELGKTFGVTVAQENVNIYSSDSPDFIKRMRKFCGENCAFVFDVKQAVRGGVDPFQILAAMGRQVVHVHINDNGPASDCMLPGCGSMDFAKMMRILKKSGFDGTLTIEVYRKSFGGLDELPIAGRFVQDLI